MKERPVVFSGFMLRGRMEMRRIHSEKLGSDGTPGMMTQASKFISVPAPDYPSIGETEKKQWGASDRGMTSARRYFLWFHKVQPGSKHFTWQVWNMWTQLYRKTTKLQVPAFTPNPIWCQSIVGLVKQVSDREQLITPCSIYKSFGLNLPPADRPLMCMANPISGPMRKKAGERSHQTHLSETPFTCLLPDSTHTRVQPFQPSKTSSVLATLQEASLLLILSSCHQLTQLLERASSRSLMSPAGMWPLTLFQQFCSSREPT